MEIIQKRNMKEDRQVISSLSELRKNLEILEKEQEKLGYVTPEYARAKITLEIAQISMGIIEENDLNDKQKDTIWEHTWNEIMTACEKEREME